MHIRPQRVQGKADQVSYKDKDCFSLTENFLRACGSFESGDREKKWAMINDAIIADALVSVTVNSQQRPALNMSSRVQKCMLTDRRRHREKREQVHYSFKTGYLKH